MEAKRQADRANLAKSEFLSRMSHELRTPLNAILGFGQILVRQKLGTQNEESVNYILMGGRHLLQLINEVLDIARVESGHIDLSIEVVEVGLIVRECLDLARTIAEEHQVRLNPQDGDQCRSFALADQRRLKQVILNLVSNGIKYNVLGGSVGIRCAESVDGRVLIEVVDTGIGFRPEDLPKLFTPFERLDANNSAVEGTGLGLALSHRLVQQMGGTIEVDSLEIPELESVLHPGRISTVLCIEDNPLNLRLLESIFARRPEITLLTAGRGLEGIEAAIRHHPDLVLLDLDLPDISGLRVLQALRLTNGLETVPVIVVSADATRGQIAKLMAAGAADYVTKPLDVAVLLRAVDAALDARASA
jgi:signal transduction histidine kinase